MEEQEQHNALQLQLQHLRINQDSQLGDFMHQQPYNTHVQRNLHQQYCLINNNVPTMEEINFAMGGLMYGHSMSPPPWRGLVVSWAMDRHDCHNLQTVIEEGNPTYVEMILSEVKDNLFLLMTHPFANYLIQKIFQARSVTLEQKDSLVYLIIFDDQKLKRVCMDNHGTRVVQIMLENIKSPFLNYIVVNTMKPITAALMKNLNASYVIMQCVKLFPPHAQSIILDEVARNCVHIATNKIGTSAIQKCLIEDHITAKVNLIAEIISNAMILAEDPYGNYVLQAAIKLKFPTVIKLTIEELRGKFVRLSMNKFASNVVEVLLRVSDQNDAKVIVDEIMRSHKFLDVLHDSFGNYVAQRALQYTKGHLRRELYTLINSNHKELHSHVHGKNVLKMAKIYIEEGKVQRCMDHNNF